MMELLRAAVTVGAMSAFGLIVWWAYAPSRKRTWEERGQLDD